MLPLRTCSASVLSVGMWRQAQRPQKHEVKRKGTKTKKKPAWDNTVRDLTVHQLSKEELELRRSRILSKNAEKAKRELEDISKDARQLKSAGSLRGNSTVGKSSNKVQDKELHSVLEESDRAIAVVKDLFGDDPKRYSAHPIVTVAPHVTADKSALQRTLLENQRDGPTPSALNTPGGIRDESILGLAPAKPALNELPSPSSEFSIGDSAVLEDSSLPTTPPGPSYHPAVVDLPRFQRLVELGEGTEETRREEGDTPQTTTTGAQHNIRAGTAPGRLPPGVETDLLSSIPLTGSQQGDTTVVSSQSADGGTRERQRGSGASSHFKTARGGQHPLNIVHKKPLQTDTGSLTAPEGKEACRNNEVSRNQRFRKLPPGGVSSSSKEIHDELSILQGLVENLEQELHEYEQTSGYCFPVQRPPTTHSGTFSSLTASLLASVIKLTHYLKQSEVQLKGEVAVRNQLLCAMAEQQNLMDALTADVVKLQEENVSLKSRFQQFEEHTTHQAKTLEEGMLELRGKLSSLEQMQSQHFNKEPTATIAISTTSPSPYYSESTPHSAPIMTSSAPLTLASLCEPVTTTPLTLQTKLHSIAPVSLPPLSSTLPSYIIPSSTPSIHPLTPSAMLTSIPPILTHGSTPAYPFCNSTGAKDEKQPAAHFDAATSLSTIPRSVGGLSLATISPSECGVSPPPLSVALQVPSLAHLQPHSLSFQTPSPLLAPNLLPPTAPLTSFPANMQPTKPPLSLPYAWLTPQTPASVTLPVDRSSSAMYHTPVQSSVSSDTFSFISSIFTAPSQPELTPASAMSLPNLSLTNMSLPAPDSSTLREDLPPISSNNSLDIEASLARMSSLARSVLKELAEDRGQLLRVTEPVSTPRLPVPTPSHSSSVHPSSLPVRSSVSSSMTSVSSLDSTAGSQLTSVVSEELESAPSVEETTQPLPESAAGTQSAGKNSSTPLQT